MVVTEASVAQMKANQFLRGAPAGGGGDENRRGASVASALLTA